jgi:fluoride exporter
MSYLIVFLGGGLGAALRHGVNLVFTRWFGSDFPSYTLFVNISGSFAMGLLAGYFASRGEAPQQFRLFLVTGFLGGYTTFSAFSLEATLLWERGQWWIAGGYTLASVIGAIGGLVLGQSLVRQLN